MSSLGEEILVSLVYNDKYGTESRAFVMLGLGAVYRRINMY